ncbi:thymidylate synthase [Bacillus cereus group sp. MYBK5-1]|uniref:thymidylate synthase n=1 Tax=Bacillus cereus group sp. MYBK5-1 TaxID=3450623 RepID=UPI003F7A4D96
MSIINNKTCTFRLVASELLWLLKGDKSLCYLLENNNDIWSFQEWLEADEYNGPDMKKFGICSQEDEEFNVLCREQIKLYRERILSDEELGDCGNVCGKQ